MTKLYAAYIETHTHTHTNTHTIWRKFHHLQLTSTHIHNLTTYRRHISILVRLPSSLSGFSHISHICLTDRSCIRQVGSILFLIRQVGSILFLSWGSRQSIRQLMAAESEALSSRPPCSRAAGAPPCGARPPTGPCTLHYFPSQLN